MNIQKINEGAGPLAGLPKHWIKFLTNKYDNKQYGKELAGEHSNFVKLKGEGLNPGWIKHALKDTNNLAVIGKVDNEPIFMIAKGDTTTTKYNIFEVTKGQGRYDSKGLSYSRGGGRGRRRYITSDSYTMNEIIDIIDKMSQGKSFENMEVYSISKDPERNKKVDTRLSQKAPIDPLYVKTPENRYSDPSPNVAQRERAKKYSSLKRPKIDAELDKEVDKIKDQVINVLDKAIEKFIQDVKNGYTFSVNKETLGRNITNAIDITGISKLAHAYSAIKTDYSSNKPNEIAQELKKTGLA